MEKSSPKWREWDICCRGKGLAPLKWGQPILDIHKNHLIPQCSPSAPRDGVRQLQEPSSVTQVGGHRRGPFLTPVVCGGVMDVTEGHSRHCCTPSQGPSNAVCAIEMCQNSSISTSFLCGWGGREDNPDVGTANVPLRTPQCPRESHFPREDEVSPTSLQRSSKCERWDCGNAKPAGKNTPEAGTEQGGQT